MVFLPTRSDSLTPRAREHAVHTWIWMSNEIVFDKISLKGGHPIGTTESETHPRIRETASPSKNMWTLCPASEKAFPWRKANAALGSSDPDGLLISSLLIEVSSPPCRGN